MRKNDKRLTTENTEYTEKIIKNVIFNAENAEFAKK
jgi:hypothetical protein